MSIDYSSIGLRIKFHRIRSGFTQEELADRTELSRVHISCIERGERIPSLDAIVCIANALSASVDELLEDNLLISNETSNLSQFDTLLDCSLEETELLMKALTALREILRAYKIKR